MPNIERKDELNHVNNVNSLTSNLIFSHDHNDTYSDQPINTQPENINITNHNDDNIKIINTLNTNSLSIKSPKDGILFSNDSMQGDDGDGMKKNDISSLSEIIDGNKHIIKENNEIKSNDSSKFVENDKSKDKLTPIEIEDIKEDMDDLTSMQMDDELHTKVNQEETDDRRVMMKIEEESYITENNNSNNEKEKEILCNKLNKIFDSITTHFLSNFNKNKKYFWVNFMNKLREKIEIEDENFINEDIPVLNSLKVKFPLKFNFKQLKYNVKLRKGHKIHINSLNKKADTFYNKSKNYKIKKKIFNELKTYSIKRKQWINSVSKEIKKTTLW
jgi:hypothetical protein